MENHKLQPLTEEEKRLAEMNHNLVYAYLHTYGYSIENFYNIVIFGYLKGIQIFNRREDLRKKYDLPFICWQYMRAEMGNYFRTEQAKKRKPLEKILSLDAEYSETENLQNCIGGKSAEDEIMEKEQIKEVLNNLSDVQRKIVEMKMKGYGNNEVYLLLEIPSSTFYKELNRIKSMLEKLVG